MVGEHRVDIIVGDEVQDLTQARPVDSGIAYALAHRMELCKLAILPTLVQILSSYILFSQTLLRQQKYLVIVLSALAAVWLLTSVLMMAFDHAVTKRREVNLLSLSLRSLQGMPKVLVAYVVILLVVTLGLTSVIIPGVIFMVFLLWAPAFCVGEEYAKRILPVKAKDEEESLDFEEQMIRKARHYFTYMSIWELGLSRSTRFSGKHLQPALAITLLIFSSALIPGAVVSLVVPGVWSFAGELLGIVLSSFTSVFALATLAWTFLLLLPAGARKELGIEPEIDLNASLDLASRKVVRFEGQSLKFAFLIVISAIAGWLLLEEAKVRTAMPKSVSATLLSAESTTADYVVSFRLEDSKDEFRWLIPYNFRLKLFSPADAEKEAPVSLPKLDLLSQLGGLGDDTFLRPTRVDIFDADGRVLSPESVSPLYRPIKLVLFYQIPPNLPERGRFELHYMSLIRAEQPVLAGDYHIPGGHAADLKK